MAEGTIKVSGYNIQEQIYGGSRTLVYKGIRESDHKPVVVKLLRKEYPTFNEIVQFRNQYSIINNLDIPGIVKPYSLETFNNSYALVMEDFGGISLTEWSQNNVKRLHVTSQYVASPDITSPDITPQYVTSLEDFLIIAIQITTILDQLHRKRVIHKDIKPANIIINPTTKQIKIIDFSISSLLPRETQQLQNPNILEGTLAYISPEQTGRMNRGIDYRTDFYSLGVTFYELLTGTVPFISHDPMELVHSHIAKILPSVNDINKNIPEVISNIINKLLEKNAEDRYQTSLGLKYDLETCLSEYKQTGKIASFPLGSRDISDFFLIPEKLYGREKEVDILLKEYNNQLIEKNSTTQQFTNPQVAKYRFSHDQVQQAAYSQIPVNQRQKTHLKIGQLLQQNFSETEQEEKLFDIIGHLNIGQDLITLADEREALAKLNLRAGQKANNTTAYAMAITYVKTGIELLKSDSWQSQYDLTLALYITFAEAAYLNSDFEGMEEIAALVLQKAQTIFDQIKIYEIQIGAKTVQGKLLEAIAIGQNALQKLEIKEIKEINLSTHQSEAEIGKALQNVANQLQGREIEKLLDLPLMTDIRSQSAMQILTMMLPPTFQGNPGLFPLWIAIMMSLSLQWGNTTASCMSYAGYGMVLCAYMGDIEAGYAFGKLAINLLDRWNARSVESIVLDIFGAFIQHHQEPLKAGMHTLKTGYTTGVETGWYLIKAERHRVLGEKLEAIECYDNAISLAQKNEYLNEEALANELAAKFYLEWGRERISRVYMTSAYYCYIRWGAKAKLNNLSKLYPKLLTSIFQQEYKQEYYSAETSETIFSTSLSTATSNQVTNTGFML